MPSWVCLKKKVCLRLLFANYTHEAKCNTHDGTSYLRLAKLTLGYVDLVSVQLVHVSDDLGALDRQQDEARGHLRGERADNQRLINASFTALPAEEGNVGKLPVCACDASGIDKPLSFVFIDFIPVGVASDQNVHI